MTRPKTESRIDRRTFLRGLGLSGGGLVVAGHLPYVPSIAHAQGTFQLKAADSSAKPGGTPRYGVAQRLDDARLVIVQDGDPLHRAAEPGDLLREPEAIRVLDLANQQLFADAEDLDRRRLLRLAV